MNSNYFSIVFLFIISVVLMGCGDDSDSKTPAAVAPKVVSTTPAAGATDVTAGAVNVTVTYDQTITFRSSKDNILISGGTISSVRAQGKDLFIVANCPEGKMTVSITIPEGWVMSTQGVSAPAFTLTFTTVMASWADPDDQSNFETAAQAVLHMTPGWNLGNTLDSHGAWIGDHKATSAYETAWGQPVTDAHLMKAVREKGFKGMRIPVTWYQHMDAEGRVDKDWMDRVQQVVDYVMDAGLYCLLNVHHDTGAASDEHTPWVRASQSSYSQNRERFEFLWRQIAERFADYDEHLLFEGYNEMLDDASQWNAPKSAADLQYVNSYAQSFVNAVRATGGKNLKRNLIVNTYAAAQGSDVLKPLVVPTDPSGSQSHLAVQVHSYNPWNWVGTYNKKWTAECRRDLEQMFARLNTYVISKGYPVIIGEYATNGEGEMTINASSTVEEKAEAGRHAADMNRLCRRYAAASFYWMSLIDGRDRTEATFKWSMEQVADSIINVYK